MKSVDITGEVAADRRIAVPPEIAAQVPTGEPVQIVLRWGGSDDEADWRAAGRRLFEAAYAADDSVYEQLIDDAPAR